MAGSGEEGCLEMLDNPFGNAKDSIRGSAASLLGKEKTWQDEVGAMCPSMTYTQVSPEIDRPLCTASRSGNRPWTARRMNTALIPRVSGYSDSGVSGSAVRWAFCSLWGCVALRYCPDVAVGLPVHL
eukprot:COSAG02_NODE_17797_length_980_cov_1.322361_2_plen_127_part_00